MNLLVITCLAVFRAMTIRHTIFYNNSMRLRKETRRHLLNLLINNSLEDIKL